MFSLIEPNIVKVFNAMTINRLSDLYSFDNEDFEVIYNSDLAVELKADELHKVVNQEWRSNRMKTYVVAVTDPSEVCDRYVDEPFIPTSSFTYMHKLGKRKELIASITNSKYYGFIVNLDNGATHLISNTNGNGWRRGSV